jgi:hypothetical protein
MKRLLLASAILAAIAGQAHAAEKYVPITIDFVGDWCFNQEDSNGAYYKLPSWTEGGCKNILSIDKWAFTFTEDNLYCRVLKIKTKSDTAPSGTNYDATITGRCWRSGQVETEANSKVRTFVFSRYKGSLDVKELRK